MDESKVRRAMRHVLQQATLPLHFSPHCLRHTYASLMLQQGDRSPTSSANWDMLRSI
jgi:integrase